MKIAKHVVSMALELDGDVPHVSGRVRTSQPILPLLRVFSLRPVLSHLAI